MSVFSFYDHIFLWIVLDIYTYIKEVSFSYINIVLSSWSVAFLYTYKMLCESHTFYGARIAMKLCSYASTDWLYTDCNDSRNLCGDSETFHSVKKLSLLSNIRNSV